MKSSAAAMVVALAACCASASADDEASNRAVLRSSTYGGVYARSVPDDRYGQRGKTRVFSVGKDADALVCEYAWYANEMYLGGDGDRTLVRFGPWQRGHAPQADHLALGIYRDGKMLREYSTLDLQQMGSGVSRSVSHYAVVQEHRGFRRLKDGAYIYDATGIGGKVLRFDLATGAPRSAD